LLFIGKRGQNYIGNRRGYRVVQEFARVAKNANVEGRAFYDLRRTFQTIGEGANDLAAVQFIMGHAAGNSDMSAVYRQLVSDDRLRAVTSHIHKWLFNSDGTADEVDAKPVRRFRVVG
jgi:integrase